MSTITSAVSRPISTAPGPSGGYRSNPSRQLTSPPPTSPRKLVEWSDPRSRKSRQLPSSSQAAASFGGCGGGQRGDEDAARGREDVDLEAAALERSGCV